MLHPSSAAFFFKDWILYVWGLLQVPIIRVKLLMCTPVSECDLFCSLRKQKRNCRGKYFWGRRPTSSEDCKGLVSERNTLKSEQHSRQVPEGRDKLSLFSEMHMVGKKKVVLGPPYVHIHTSLKKINVLKYYIDYNEWIVPLKHQCAWLEVRVELMSVLWEKGMLGLPQTLDLVRDAVESQNVIFDSCS